MADDNQLQISFGGKVDSSLPASASTAKAAVSELSKEVSAQAGVIANSSQSASALTGSLKNVEVAATSAGHGTAGFYRELIVLGHEMSMGNYNRFGGSLMVLAERSGKLTEIFGMVRAVATPMNLAIGATVGILAAVADGAYHAEAALAEVRVAFASVGNEFLFDPTQVRDMKAALEDVGVGARDAEAALVALARTTNLSSEEIQKVKAVLPDLVSKFGSAEAAVKAISGAADDTSGAWRRFHDEIARNNPMLAMAGDDALAAGDKSKAASILIDYLTSSAKGLTEKGVTPLGRAWRSLNELLGPAAFVSPIQKLRDLGDGAAIAATKVLTLVQAMRLQAKYGETSDQAARQIRVQNSGQSYNMDQSTAYKEALAAKNVAEVAAHEKAIEERKKETEEKARLAKRDAKSGIDSQNDILESTRTSSKEIIDIKAQEVEAKREMGLISEQDEIAQLTDLKNQEYQIELKALQQQLAINGQTVQETKRINDQIKVLEEQHQLDLLKIKQKAFDDGRKIETKDLSQSDKDWKSYANSIVASLKSAFSQMLQGTLNWKQAVGQALISLAGTVFDKQVDHMVDSWVTGEAAKTGATIAGNASRTASNVAATSAGSAAENASNEATIQKDAAKAAAGAYSAIVGIPYVGPILAPAAAAVAFTAVEGYENLASFDVGSWSVPSDMTANIHQGEMILPKPFAQSLRENGGLGGGSPTHITINAVDAKSVSRLIRANGGAVAASLANAARMGNRSVNAPR